MCQNKQIMSRDAHMAATVAPLVFAIELQRHKNTNTKKLFPFSVLCLRKEKQQ